MFNKLGIAKAAFAACLAGLIVPAHAEDPSWDAVVSAAKKEGKVVLYTATDRQPRLAKTAIQSRDSRRSTASRSQVARPAPDLGNHASASAPN